MGGEMWGRGGWGAVMGGGLGLQGVGFGWVAARGSVQTSWIELVIALLVAGIGIAMALPTAPTAVLNSVAETEMGKASGINYMVQRFGAVFNIAIASTVFSAHGNLNNPTSLTARFPPVPRSCLV